MFASASVTPCSSAHIVGARPGEADDGVQDDVRLGPLEQLGQVAAGLGQRREAVDRLRARRGGDELELGMRVDHLDRLAPDRAGRAEQGDPLHIKSGYRPCPAVTSAAASLAKLF